jgi:hypothetical protein
MSFAVEMSCEGFEELRQRLSELATKDANRILNKALRTGGLIFQGEEEERAPERPELPSGTALPPGALRRDVHVRKLPGKKPIWIIGPGKYTSQAAHLVEFGHRIVQGGKNRLKKYGIQVGPGNVTGQVPPHPYARPAFESAHQLVMDAITESIKADIARLDNKAARKGGR